MIFKLNTILTALLVSTSFSTLAAPISNAGEQMVNPNAGVVVGYWHNWCGGSGYQGGTAPCITLKEINPMYNVVDVSFMKVYNTAEGRIPTFRVDPATGLSEQAFIDEIATLNKQGRAVLLALGGADAHIELRTGDEQAFADEVIRLTDKFGFDGLDIDLEQEAVTAANNQTVIPAALRLVKDHYRSQGKNFLITMAPEFPYLTVGGKYVPYISGLEGYYDWINPQFYNQGGDGVYAEGIGWVAQSNDNLKEEFIYYMSDSLVNGTRGFYKIPHDKLVFGLPSNIDAAATGTVKDPNDLYQAFDRLKQQNQPLRGVMTWSVNWDMGVNSAGVSYNQKFINDYGSFIHGQTPPPPAEGVPVFSGLSDIRVKHNSSFDLLAGVSAVDFEDGDITAHIIVEGQVNTSLLGSYPLIYRATDSNANVTTAMRMVEVYSAKPEIKGAVDTSISVGSPFDPRQGVNASDNEDGDLNSKMLISGQFDINEPGHYLLTYSVTDSANQTISVLRNLTVTDGSITVDIWNENAVYLQGEMVIFNGKKYIAQWWTKGDEPSNSAAWVEVSDGSVSNWDIDKAYNGSERVTFNGLLYEAKWWTKGDRPDLENGPWKQL